MTLLKKLIRLLDVTSNLLHLHIQVVVLILSRAVKTILDLVIYGHSINTRWRHKNIITPRPLHNL